MNNSELQKFLIKKAGRQAILEDRKKILEELEVDILASKIGTSFQGFYYFLKRFIVFALAIILIFVGAFILIKPSVLTDQGDFKSFFVESYKSIYLLEAQDKLSDAVYSMVKNREVDRIESFITGLDSSIEKSAENIIYSAARIIGILLILLSIVLWYVSRLTKKLQKRNALIKKADSLSKEILIDYKKTIDEEAQELELLKNLVNNNNPV